MKYSPEQNAEFDAFWKIYPRRVAKAPARKAWVAALRKAPADKICEALCAQLAAGFFREATYTPYPASWLNQERWEDETVPGRTPADGFATRYREACRRGDDAAKARVITEARASGIEPHMIYEAILKQRETEGGGA